MYFELSWYYKMKTSSKTLLGIIVCCILNESQQHPIDSDSIHKVRFMRTSYVGETRITHTIQGYLYERPSVPFTFEDNRDLRTQMTDTIADMLRVIKVIDDHLPTSINNVPEGRTLDTDYNVYPNSVTNELPPFGSNNEVSGYSPLYPDSKSDDSDNVRPISFETVPPKRPPIRKQPKVDHGSTQEGQLTES